MKELFEILPMIILYLTCGYTFLCGLYILIDKRFDFFSDISFSIMLVLGFLINTIIYAIPINFKVKNEYIEDSLLIGVSFIIGILVAVFRNTIGFKVENFIIDKCQRRKTYSESFWYDILDEKDKPVWLRLTNLEKEYVLDGVLVKISEEKENPYILLGYCKKYHLDGKPILQENINSEDGYIQKIIRVDSFDEITVFYGENSRKKVTLEIN